MRRKSEHRAIARYARQQKEQLPFTVTTIGGPEEHKVWKANQDRVQAEWEANRQVRYAKFKGTALETLITGKVPTPLEQAEIHWQVKNATAELHRRYGMLRGEDKANYIASLDAVPPPKPLIQKVKDSLWGLLQSAFGNSN